MNETPVTRMPGQHTGFLQEQSSLENFICLFTYTNNGHWISVGIFRKPTVILLLIQTHRLCEQWCDVMLQIPHEICWADTSWSAG